MTAPLPVCEVKHLRAWLVLRLGDHVGIPGVVLFAFASTVNITFYLLGLSYLAASSYPRYIALLEECVMDSIHYFSTFSMPCR